MANFAYDLPGARLNIKLLFRTAEPDRMFLLSQLFALCTLLVSFVSLVGEQIRLHSANRPRLTSML